MVFISTDTSGALHFGAQKGDPKQIVFQNGERVHSRCRFLHSRPLSTRICGESTGTETFFMGLIGDIKRSPTSMHDTGLPPNQVTVYASPTLAWCSAFDNS